MSSEAFNGQDQLLYCPDTRIISNITILDQYGSSLVGILPRKFTNQTKPALPVLRNYSRQWTWNPKHGSNSYTLMEVILNINSTVNISAQVQNPFKFQIQAHYHTVDEKHIGFDSRDSQSPIQFDYLFKSTKDARYYFNFRSETPINQANITFLTNETQYLSPQEMMGLLPSPLRNECFTGSPQNPGFCTYNLTWGSTDCILTYFTKQRDFSQNRWCVIFYPVGRGKLWTGILLGAFPVALLVIFLINVAFSFIFPSSLK